MLVFLVILIVILTAFLALWLFLALRYPHVNPGLRLLGAVISAFTSYDSVKGLRRFAGMANRFMPVIFPFRSRSMITKKVTIRGIDGNDIPLVIYSPKNQKPDATGFLWIHGGGFAIGTPGGEKSFLKPFVTELNTVAVVPDYTFSVKAPYPAAFNDCSSALLWMKDNALKLGINPNQLFIGGASAGGGLAASLSLYARDSGLVRLAYQFPIYPMANDRMDTASMKGNNEFLWNEKRNRAAWETYLGSLYGSDEVPCYASPLRAEDFSGLPPCYTFVGTLDPFYDETIMYINALREAGVMASYDTYEAAFHGFDVIPSKISRKARRRLLEVYKEAVRTAFSDGQPQP